MSSAALSVTSLPPARQPLIHPPIAAMAGFANFRFIPVTSSIKLLQRLHMAPRIISRPYLSIYSSLGPAELSKLISYTLHLRHSNQIQQLLILQTDVSLYSSSGHLLCWKWTSLTLYKWQTPIYSSKSQLRCPSSYIKHLQDFLILN